MLLELPDPDPFAVLGAVDAQKLQSCMTLFSVAEPAEPVFAAVLSRYFDGVRDTGTTSRL